MSEPDSQSEPPRQGAQEEPPPRILQTEEVFGGKREIWIEHAGVRYRLRITRRNRLILQK
jgi:hemin uptake protein HemP